MSGSGNEAMVRAVADQVADAAVARFAQLHPMPESKMEIPAPLKWAAAIVTAIMASGAVAMALWVVSTLSDLQITVARMDERQQQDVTGQRVTENARRIKDVEDRVSVIEKERRGT